jgi:phosphotriesterase-related protein
MPGPVQREERSRPVPEVETTEGPIDADRLGRTLIHEHLMSASEAVRYQFPHLYDFDDERERSLAALRAVKEQGFDTFVDPGCMDLARDAALARELAAEAGIQMVLCTGVYGQHYTFLPHYFQNRDEDHLAGAFVHDIESDEGIQGTGVKAAFIKCAADEPGITPDVEKIHRAAARASLQTGRPIMAHSRPASKTGLDQMRIFMDEGVDPRMVQIAHTGDTDDLDHIEELLQTGCWIGLDRFGIDLFLPDDRRIPTFVTLVERGYTDRIMLGCDAVANLDWFPAEIVQQLAPQWTHTHLVEHILPAARERGVTDEQITVMLEDNPKAWLTA